MDAIRCFEAEQQAAKDLQSLAQPALVADIEAEYRATRRITRSFIGSKTVKKILQLWKSSGDRLPLTSHSETVYKALDSPSSFSRHENQICHPSYHQYVSLSLSPITTRFLFTFQHFASKSPISLRINPGANSSPLLPSSST